MDYTDFLNQLRDEINTHHEPVCVCRACKNYRKWVSDINKFLAQPNTVPITNLPKANAGSASRTEYQNINIKNT